jgi:hypothetical protein
MVWAKSQPSNSRFLLSELIEQFSQNRQQLLRRCEAGAPAGTDVLDASGERASP